MQYSFLFLYHFLYDNCRKKAIKNRLKRKKYKGELRKILYSTIWEMEPVGQTKLNKNTQKLLKLVKQRKTPKVVYEHGMARRLSSKLHESSSGDGYSSYSQYE